MPSKKSMQQKRSGRSLRGTATNVVLNTNDRVIGTPSYRPVLGPTEQKVLDTVVTAQNVVSGGTIVQLTNVPTGTSAAARIGNELLLTSLSGRFSVANVSTTLTSDETNEVRVIFAYDKQANAATPTVTDLLSLARPDSTLQDNNKGRFIVIKDYYFGVGFNSDVIKCKEVMAELDVSCLFGATSIPLTGSIFMLYISDSTALPAPVINANMRVTFRDQ
jgi:hypothetical protein